ADTTLSLRRSCKSASSELSCNDDIDEDNSLSRVVVALDPGTYWLVTGGADDQPADVTLRWGPASAWPAGAAAPPGLPPPPAGDVPPEPNPRLVTNGADVTPSSEPLPAATVDRLVRVRLVPGVAGTLPVVLRGACAGTMAKLSAASATQVAVGDALTCVDDPS